MLTESANLQCIIVTQQWADPWFPFHVLINKNYIYYIG